MGRRIFYFSILRLRPQLCKLVPTSLLQIDRKFRGKNCSKVNLERYSRSTKGSSLAISLPEAQALCYITVQKDGLAFAALADDQYPERIMFMVLKKMAQ